MSTNPFRQIRTQTDGQSATNQPTQPKSLSEGSGSRPVERSDLSLDVNAVNNSYQRHVSFASPPVDSTISAVSYPSSPESARSPPSYFNRAAGLPTPDYRTAIHSDPFGDLVRDKQEDGTLQQAVFNAQSNIAVSQPPGQPEQPQERAVWDTLSRFASTSSRPAAVESSAAPPPQDSRKSLDVDAFKRLLLTGNTVNTGTQDQQSARRPAPPPPKNPAQDVSSTSSALGTTFGINDPSSSDASNLNAKKASFLDSLMQPSSEGGSLETAGKLPPPAPAPRRAKSVKSRDLSPLPPSPNEPASQSEAQGSGLEKAPRRPPAPPIARRQSQRIPSNKSDDSIATPSPTASPAEPVRPTSKPPPPPPIRRQSSTTTRRPSHDLAPTIEEPETEHNPVPALGSRTSSADQPSVSGSKNPSLSSKPTNPGLMNPPPLPPPRRGRGSSRSSMDGFRPSLATLIGDEENQENAANAEQSRRTSTKDRSSLTASNADSILAELANLQREVDAARHG